MSKKPNNQTALEHATIEPIQGNVVKLIADEGWLLRSKHTGKTVHSAITSHISGWEVLKEKY